MKPNVFLSHSKADKNFIEKVANDLRNARIAVWYDEWEIPIGESFRKKIFEDGISSCDLFLVYLTENSVNSYWVKSELDAAFIRDANTKGSSLAIFVNSDEIRINLPLDVQALHSPVFNDENYHRPLNQLISRVWEVTSEKRIKYSLENQKLNILELEKENAELQMQLLRLENLGRMDIESIEQTLVNSCFFIRKRTVTYFDIFSHLVTNLASGATDRMLKQLLTTKLELPGFDQSLDEYGIKIDEILGKFIIFGLVRIQPETEHSHILYYLTELGLTLARKVYGI